MVAVGMLWVPPKVGYAALDCTTVHGTLHIIVGANDQAATCQFSNAKGKLNLREQASISAEFIVASLVCAL